MALQTVAKGGIEATGTAQTVAPASPRLADSSEKQDQLPNHKTTNHNVIKSKQTQKSPLIANGLCII